MRYKEILIVLPLLLFLSCGEMTEEITSSKDGSEVDGTTEIGSLSKVVDDNCGYPYSCWWYAMDRLNVIAATTIHSVNSEFGYVHRDNTEAGDIIRWGNNEHVAYVSTYDVSTGNIGVHDFNHKSRNCGIRNPSGGEPYTSPLYFDNDYQVAASGVYKKIPANPTYGTPSNNASVTNSVTLDWNGPGDSYWLEVSTNNSFTASAIVHRDETVDESQKTIPTLGAGTYYWRVQARRGPYTGSVPGTWLEWINSADWSGGTSPRSFTVQSPCSPISTPIINQAIYNGHPKIYWNSISGADQYKVYKSSSSSSGPYYFSGLTTQTNWVDNFEDIFSGINKEYRWYKVKAINSTNCSPNYTTVYSNYRMVTVNGGGSGGGGPIP